MVLAPLITLVGLGLAAIFRVAWNPLRATDKLPLPQCRNLCLGLFLACVPWSFDLHMDNEWIAMALIAVGPSYLSLLLLGLRLTIIKRFRRFFPLVLYFPWIVLYPSAFFLAYLGSTTAETSDFHLQLWLYPGSFGLVTGPLFLVIVVELVVRHYVHRKREAAMALPRPLPTATAKFR